MDIEVMHILRRIYT